MRFGTALECARDGVKIARLGWNGKGMWVAYQAPTPESKMSLPYLYMKTADNKLVPWLASQTDILADDWILVAEITAANEAEAKFELEHDDLG